MAYKPRSSKSKKSMRMRKSKYLKGGSGVIKATKTLSFPDRVVVKLPWTTSQTISNPALSAASNYTIRLNSVWDPDQAVGSGQISAGGYPTYAQIYNRYRVIGVKVISDAVNPNTGIPLKCWYYGTNDVVTSGSNQQPLLQPHLIEGILGPFPSSSCTKRMTKYFSLARITGVSDSTYRSDDRYQAVCGSNPTETIMCNFQATPVGNGSGGGLDFQVQYNLKVIYYVEFFDRKFNIPLSEVPVETQAAQLEQPGSDV